LASISHHTAFYDKKLGLLALFMIMLHIFLCWCEINMFNDSNNDYTYKINCLQKFSAWINALKQQQAGCNTDTSPESLYTEALILSIQHSNTIDDLFSPNSERRKILTPVYKELNTTLETSASRHMEKAFYVLHNCKRCIRNESLSALEKIVTDQIKTYKDQISAKVLVRNRDLSHNYGAIPTEEKTCDDKGEETPQNCAELVKNCFKAMFG